jgi:hypothetical protein
MEKKVRSPPAPGRQQNYENEIEKIKSQITDLIPDASKFECVDKVDGKTIVAEYDKDGKKITPGWKCVKEGDVVRMIT